MNPVILAPSFGKPDCAGGNRLTAKWAGIISQGSIPIASDVSVPLDNRTYAIYRIGSVYPEDHVSTLALMREFSRLCMAESWNLVIVVCAPDYANRVVRDLKKAFEAFKETMFYPVVLKAELSGKEKPKAWYAKCANSWHWRTESRFFFRIYDLILRLMPFWLYEKVTTR
jgi:hypothetical protein